MTLRRLAVRVGMLWHREQLVYQQNKLIRLLKEQRNLQQLNHTRELHGLVGVWLVSLEQPEIDMRDALADMEQALGERLSVLEEHIV